MRIGTSTRRLGAQFAALAALALGVAQACTSRDVVGIGVGTVGVQPSAATLLEGDSVQLSAVVRDEGGNAIPAANPTWYAEDDAPVAVGPTGMVRAIRAGAGVVTASFQDQTGTAFITVLSGPSVDPSAEALFFRLDRDAVARPPQTIDLRNAGSGSLSGLTVSVVYAAGATDWLDVALSGSTTPTRLTASPLTSGMTNGRYAATVRVAAASAPGDTLDIPVSLSLASVTVNQSGGSTIVDERGSSDQISAALGLRPESDVVLRVETEDPGEVGISTSILVFTPTNWADPQFVTVTGISDDEADGVTVTPVTFSVDAAASDEAYGPVAPRSVDVRTRDAVGLSVTATGGSTRAVEGGARDTIRVALDIEPTEDVILSVDVDDEGDAAISPSSLSFTPSNWNRPQVVVFRAVNDDIADGTQERTLTISVDPSSDTIYAGRPALTISASTEDDEIPSFRVTESGGSTEAVEGGASDEISVRLDVRPLSAVIFDVSVDDRRDASISPTALLFTSGNWNIPQVVAFTAVDDPDADGDRTRSVRFSVNPASDGVFVGLPDEVVDAVTIDDESATIIVSETNGSTAAAEAGGRDSISVVLGARAPTDVVVDISVDDSDDASVSPTSLTFSPDGWNIPQWVIFRAVDDPVVDGPRDRTITVAVDGSSDPIYRDAPDQTIDALTVDDDGAAFTITESGDRTIVTEAGSTDQFEVVLDTRPLTPVIIDIVSADEGEVTLAPARLTFQPEDWNKPKTVTVTGVDDSAGDGDTSTDVILSIADGSDPAFAALDPQVVSVTTTDDDVVGISITETGATIVGESGDPLDAFDVRLLAQPTSNVVLSITPKDPTEVAVGLTSLTFTSSDWDAPKSVPVRGVDDEIADGDVVSVVEIAVAAGASDESYDTVSVRTVNVVTLDDERAGFRVIESGGSTVVDEDGGRDTIRVVLDVEPLDDVRIDLDPEDVDQSTLSATSLRFTPDSWDVPQIVEVRGRNDEFVEGVQTSDVLFTVRPGSDPAYEGLSSQTIDVRVRDDDEAGFEIRESGGDTEVEEGGRDDGFDIVLTGRPLTGVTLLVSSADPGEVEVDPVELSFSPADWDKAHTVDIAAVDDAFADGDKTTSVTVAIDATNSNDAFRSLPSQSVSVVSVDDEEAGFELQGTAGLLIPEGGASSFSVRLVSPPETPVLLNISSSSEAVSPSTVTLTFNESNWNSPQTVDLIGRQDDNEVDESVTITVAVAAGSAPAFAGLPSQSFLVLTRDDDAEREEDDEGSAAFDFALSTSGPLTVEEGAEVGFSVALTRPPHPRRPVFLRVWHEPADELELSRNLLRFDRSEWDRSQAVTVRGVRDGIRDGDSDTSVNVAVIAALSDARFAGAPQRSVPVTVRDIDGSGAGYRAP